MYIHICTRIIVRVVKIIGELAILKNVNQDNGFHTDKPHFNFG